MTSLLILIIAILWRYQESDNVRLVVECVTGHLALMRDKFVSLGIPFQNFANRLFHRQKLWQRHAIIRKKKYEGYQYKIRIFISSLRYSSILGGWGGEWDRGGGLGINLLGKNSSPNPQLAIKCLHFFPTGYKIVAKYLWPEVRQTNIYFFFTGSSFQIKIHKETSMTLISASNIV